jgi:hypothetical protein
LVIPNATTLPIPHQMIVTATARNWVQVCAAIEKSSAPVPPSEGAVRMPVPMAPMTPPTPWMPNTSRLSS